MGYKVTLEYSSKNLLELRERLNKTQCKFYVYQHIKNGNVVYIGKGTVYEGYKRETDSRQRLFNDSSREYKTKDFIDEVEVIDFYNTELEALKVEEELTSNLKKIATWTIYNKDIGKYHTEELLDNKFRKENHPMYGKHHTEESKQKIRDNSHGLPVIGIDIITGEIEFFSSSMEAERTRGYNGSIIRQCCKGKRKTHKGHIFRYATKEEIASRLKLTNEG